VTIIAVTTLEIVNTIATVVVTTSEIVATTLLVFCSYVYIKKTQQKKSFVKATNSYSLYIDDFAMHLSNNLKDRF